MNKRYKDASVEDFTEAGLEDDPAGAVRPEDLPVDPRAEYEEKKKYTHSLLEGKDPLVKAIVEVESGGDPYALGPSILRKDGSMDRAAGLMQIMKDTAKDPGFKVKGLSELERFDPKKNLNFGEKYIKALLKEFNNNTEHALMAYNWGPGITKEWIKAGSPSVDKGFKDKKGRDRTDGLRNATNYVNKVMSRLPVPSDTLEAEEAAIPVSSKKLFSLNLNEIQEDLKNASEVKNDVDKNTLPYDTVNLEYTTMEDEDPFLGLTPDTISFQPIYSKPEEFISESAPEQPPYRGGFKHDLEDWNEQRRRETDELLKWKKVYTENLGIDAPTLEAEQAQYEDSLSRYRYRYRLNELVMHPQEFGKPERQMGRARIRRLERKQLQEQNKVNSKLKDRKRKHRSFSPRFLSGKSENAVLKANNYGKQKILQAIEKGSEITSGKKPVPGSLEETFINEGKKIALDLGLTSLLVARQGYVSAAELISLAGQAGHLAYKYGIAFAGFAGAGATGNDPTIWKNLIYAWHHDKDAMMQGWDHYVKKYEEAESQFSESDIGQALGEAKEAFKDIYNYMKLTKDEETPFLRVAKFGFDLAAPAGYLGATVRGGKLLFRNAQRALILNSIAKKTGDKLPFGSLTAFRDMSFRGDSVNFGTLKYLKDNQKLEEWRKKGYTQAEAEAIMRSNSTNFRIAMGGMAGMAFGEAISSSFNLKDLGSEYGEFLPVLFGLAGSLNHKMVTKPFTAAGTSWPIGIVGTLALYGTNPKIMINRWSKEGIDPEDFNKISILGAKGAGKNLYLQLLGWSHSDVKNMKKIAIRNGNEAKLKLDDIQKQHGIDSSQYENAKQQFINDGTLNEDLSINKWSVMYTQANVSKEHSDFLKRFKINLDEMQANPRFEGDVNNIKEVFTKAMGTLEQLQSKFPNELGSFELVLSQALQSSVLQNMISVLSSKATVSARKGRWFTDRTDLFELNRMNNVVERNILAIQKVMLGLTNRIDNIDEHVLEAKKKLTQIEKTHGVDSVEYKQQQIELEKLDKDNLTDMAKIIGRMSSVLTAQRESLSGQIEVARNILSQKIQPNFGLTDAERRIVTVGLGLNTASRDLDRNTEIVEVFTKKHDDAKKINDENWTLLRDKNEKTLYDASGIVSVLLDDDVLKNPTLERLSKKIVTGSMIKSIRETGDNLLEGLDLYKRNTLDGIDKTGLTSSEAKIYESITEDLNQTVKDYRNGETSIEDAEGIAKTLIDKLSNIKSIAHNESVVRYISFDDYKQIRQYLSREAERFRSADSYDKSWILSNKIDELDEYMANSGVNVKDYEETREFYKNNLRPFYDKKGFLNQIHQSRKYGIGEQTGLTSPKESFTNFILNDDSVGSKIIFDRFFKKTDNLGNEYYDEDTFRLMAKAIGDKYTVDTKGTDALYNLKNFLQQFKGNFKVLDDKGKIVDSGYAETFQLVEKNLKQFDTHSQSTQQSFVEAKKVLQKTISDIFDEGKSKIDGSIIGIIVNDRAIDSNKFLKLILGETDDIVGTNITISKKEYNNILSGIRNKYLDDARAKFPNDADKIQEYVSEMMGNAEVGSIQDSLQRALRVSEYDPDRLVLDPALFILNEVRRTSSPQQIQVFENSLKQIFQKKFEDIMFPLTENIAPQDLSPNKLTEKVTNFLVGRDKASKTKDEAFELFKKDVKDGKGEALAILKKLGLNKEDILGTSRFKLQPDLDLPSTRMFLNNNKNFIKELFGEEQYKLYEDIFDLSVITRGKFEKAGSALSGVQWQYTTPMFLGRVHAIARGVLSPRYLAMEAGVTHWRHTRFLLMREILQDGKFAKSLHSMMLNPNPTESTKKYFAYKLAKLNSIAHIKTLNSLGIEQSQGHTVLEGGDKENNAILNQQPVVKTIIEQTNNIAKEQFESEYGYNLQLQERRYEEKYGKDYLKKRPLNTLPIPLQKRKLQMLFGEVPDNRQDMIKQNLFGSPNYDSLD